MMRVMERSYIGCYWGDRQESATEAASRLQATLDGIRDVSPALTDWFEKGDSAQSRALVPTDVEGLTRLVEQGAHRTDFGGEVMNDLGFRVGLWNGQSEESASSLTTTVGLHAADPDLSNHVLLRLPGGQGFSATLIDRLVEIWEPDWATWTTRSLRRAQGQAFRESVGWITYFRSADLAEPPAGVVARPMAGGTTVTFDKPFADVTPEDAVQVQTWLNAQGVLRPL